MFDDDVFPPENNRPASRLLDELESIKGVLTDHPEANDEALTDIPLLDDMVIHNLDNNAQLLNIGQIFDEQETIDEATASIEPLVPFPRFTLNVAISDDDHPIEAQTIAPPTSPKPSVRPPVRPDYSREVLIQELIDEFIPQIEIELHKRLQRLDDVALRRLKDTK